MSVSSINLFQNQCFPQTNCFANQKSPDLFTSVFGQDIAQLSSQNYSGMTLYQLESNKAHVTAEMQIAAYNYPEYAAQYQTLLNKINQEIALKSCTPNFNGYNNCANGNFNPCQNQNQINFFTNINQTSIENYYQSDTQNNIINQNQPNNMNFIMMILQLLMRNFSF